MNMRRRQVSKMQGFERLKECLNRFRELSKFFRPYDLDFVRERSRPVQTIGRMNNESLYAAPRVEFLKPSARTVHLFGFPLVDLRTRGVDFILAFPQHIVLRVKSPQVVWSLFPFSIWPLPAETKRATEFIECALEFLSPCAKHESVQDVRYLGIEFSIVFTGTDPISNLLNAPLADDLQSRNRNTSTRLQEHAVLLCAATCKCSDSARLLDHWYRAISCRYHPLSSSVWAVRSTSLWILFTAVK